MKKLLTLLMLASVIMFPGCNKSSTSDDDNGNNNNNNGNGGKYTISGSVHLNNVSGAGIAGVKVVLAFVSETATAPLTVTTDSKGSYSFGNIAAGNYIVTVTLTDYTFTPEYVSFTVADKNVAVQTFVGSKADTGGNAGANALYPLKTGATWTYDSVNLVSMYSIDEKVIDKVNGTKAMGGKTYWEVTSTTYDSDNQASGDDTAYFRIDNNILYTYGTDFLVAKSALKAAKPAQASALLKMAQSGSDEYPMIKFNVAAGTTWDIYRDSGSYQGNTYSIISTGKYVGTETVGNYTNCAKYEIDYTSESTTSSMVIAGRWFRTIWLAPNVGTVKSVEMFYVGDTLATISLLSTTTNTLNTVSIP